MKPQVITGIKADLAEALGRKQKRIADRWGVSRSLVSDMYTERVHKHVPWPDGFRPVPLPAKGQRRELPQHDPTNQRIIELESDIVHLREELRIERRNVQASAKEHGLFKAMAEVLENHIVPDAPLPSLRKPKQQGVVEETLVMHLSDGHHNLVVRPEECGEIEDYNFPVGCRRAEEYVNTVIDWSQRTLAPSFRFPHLVILAYGDHTSGEIHGHAQRSYFRNQLRSCLAIGQLHALMYCDLAPYFEQITVVYVPGNHGRRTQKKDHHRAHDNWDYLIAEIAKLHCVDHANIDFVIPKAFSINLSIEGIGFNIFHGDDVRGSLGIPHYGLQRRQKNIAAIEHALDCPRIRYLCCGHFHKQSTMSDADGELIVNGPWPATDAYAFNSFAAYTEPSQWLHGVRPDRGITWRLKVQLRSKHEASGPERYHIIL